MNDDFFRTENFNDEVVLKFAQYLKENDLYIMKFRPHHKVNFVVPESQEKRNKLLSEIIYALNDGFYSNDSCIAYLYELVERYQDTPKTEKDEKNKKNFDIFQ